MGNDICLGSLFIELWLIVEKRPPAQRTVCGTPASPIRAAIGGALALDDSVAAISKLRFILEAATTKDQDHQLSVMLEIMGQIDLAFYEIHPRARSTPSGKMRSRRAWLSKAQAQWYASGIYCEQAGLRLVARGPLLRQAREENATAGDSLADRYASISVVASSLLQEGCEIDITHIVVRTGGHEGVGLGRKAGNERIGFLAVAQDGADIDVRHEIKNDQHFLDFKAAGCVDVSDRVIAGLEWIGSTDIAMAPELVISESDADELCMRIPASSARFRVLVAGTGHTTATDGHSMAWNEARIVNERGVELWRQRKFWQASTPSSRAVQLGISVPPDIHCFEYNVSGNNLAVVDVESLGRCVVLICQDLTAQPIVPELLRTYQPDWVLVPIMDKDVCEGRWAHQCAFATSNRSRARFLMVTNTAYAKRMGLTDEITMALAVGPLHEDEVDKGRLCAPLTPESAHGVEFATVEWGGEPEKWKTSTLRTEKN